MSFLAQIDVVQWLLLVSLWLGAMPIFYQLGRKRGYRDCWREIETNRARGADLWRDDEVTAVTNLSRLAQAMRR